MLNEAEMVRAKVTVTVDQDLMKWVDQLVEDKKFRNRSHAVEYALYELRKKGLEEG